MRLHEIHERMQLPISLEEAWEFFSNPHNLEKITPPDLGLKVGPEVSDYVHPGMIIKYRVSPLPGISKLWVTEITQVVKNTLFVDEQRFGPYKFWHHLHQFKPASGGVIIEDVVHYIIPFDGLSGGLINRLLVKRKLKKIFSYRRDQLEKIFA